MSGTAAQRRALQDATRIASELRARGRLGTSSGEFGFCHRDGYTVRDDRLDGEFDLDEPFAQTLLQGLTAPPPAFSGPALRAMPSKPQAAGPSPSQWVSDYLLGSPADKNFDSQFQAATVGPGNILGNAASAAQIATQVNAQATTGPAIARATASVSSGAAQSVRVNEFIEVYNGNKSGRGRPRPRLRIKGMPLKVIDAAGGLPAWRARSQGVFTSPVAGAGRYAGVLGQEVGQSRIARSPLRFASRMPGAGILTFAPSAAIDAYNALELKSSANGRSVDFDWSKFATDSARSQSGNLVGLASSVAATAVAVVVFTVSGVLPLMLIGFTAGLVGQMIWNMTGMDDASAALMDRAVAR